MFPTSGKTKVGRLSASIRWKLETTEELGDGYRLRCDFGGVCWYKREAKIYFLDLRVSRRVERYSSRT